MVAGEPRYIEDVVGDEIKWESIDVESNNPLDRNCHFAKGYNKQGQLKWLMHIFPDARCPGEEILKLIEVAND